MRFAAFWQIILNTQSAPPTLKAEPKIRGTGNDPIAEFQAWMDQAKEAGLREPTAMSMATVGRDGKPHVRMLLLKGVDERGFVFYTNLNSPKAGDLKANPHAALCFYWMPLGKQVRIEGAVEPVGPEEADAYFATRPRLSQLGAWASSQSQPMNRYWDLEWRVAVETAKHGAGKVPRPPFWSGFRLVPTRIEFWKEKPFRRHERILYTLTEEGWTTQWLYP